MADLVHDFTGDDDDPWDPTVFPTIRTVTGVSPAPTIQDNTGVMVTGGTGGGFGDRHDKVAFTADTYTDTEVIVQMTTPTVGAYVMIGYRIGANITSGEPTDGYEMQWDTEESNVNIWDRTAATIIAYQRDIEIPVDVPYWWRIHCRGVRHRIRFWPVGETEPITWAIDFNDATHPAGRVYLGAFNTFGGLPATVVWDDLEINEIVPPPPGIRIGSDVDLLEALYIGDETVTAAYVGDVEVPVP